MRNGNILFEEGAFPSTGHHNAICCLAGVLNALEPELISRMFSESKRSGTFLLSTYNIHNCKYTEQRIKFHNWSLKTQTRAYKKGLGNFGFEAHIAHSGGISNSILSVMADWPSAPQLRKGVINLDK